MSHATQEPARFFFVWTKKGRVPNFAHNTRQSAEAEAKRLALANPGRKYITLKAEQKFFAEPEEPPCIGDLHVVDHRIAFEQEAV